MTVATLEQEFRARAGSGASCVSCKAASPDIELLVVHDHGAEWTITVALPDACTHVAVGTPGEAPTQLTTTLQALHQFLDGNRSPLELLLAGDWSVNVRDVTGSAPNAFDALAERLVPSSSAGGITVSAQPVVYAQSCPVLSLTEVATTYRGRMLPEAWKTLPAFDPAVALAGLDRTIGPRSFSLPLSPDLRSRGPLQSVVPEVGVLGAAQRLACGAASPDLAGVWHCDRADNLLAVLAGSKEIHLLPSKHVDPDQVRTFARTIDNVEWHLRTDQSPIDHANVEVVPVEAGDVLFLPEGWYHNVLNRTVTLAVTNWLAEPLTNLL